MKARILILSLVLLAACQEVETGFDDENTATGKAGADSVYTLTVLATKGVDTKALALDGTQLNAYWVSGEKVGVYVDGIYKGQLQATPMADATRATLSGTVTATLKANDVILLLYPDREDITVGTKWDYTGQNGTAPTPAGDLSTK